MTSGPVAMRELTIPCKRKNTIQPKERIRYGTMAYNEFTPHLKRISSSLKFTLHQSHAIICFPLELFNRLYKNLILIA